MYTYVSLVRDHSGSMSSIRNGAMNDFNLILKGLQTEVSTFHKVHASVIGCGCGWTGDVRVLESLKPVNNLKTLTSYDATGGSTPLWDSVMRAINSILYNKGDPFIVESVAYLVIVTTDGQNNSSQINSETLKRKILELQATDKWTFVFRVPKGYKKDIVNLGIPEGNVVEWEQTESGVRQSTETTQIATQAYFSDRSKGLTSTRSFYTTDLSDVSLKEVKENLKDITSELLFEKVYSDNDGSQIRDFCKLMFGEYEKGSAFYELVKPEKVQPYKKIIIKHKKSGKYYGGETARVLLGLPSTTDIKVRPGDHSGYEVYIQSTSVNRKLVKDTNVIYWKNA